MLYLIGPDGLVNREVFKFPKNGMDCYGSVPSEINSHLYSDDQRLMFDANKPVQSSFFNPVSDCLVIDQTPKTSSTGVYSTDMSSLLFNS